MGNGWPHNVLPKTSMVEFIGKELEKTWVLSKTGCSENETGLVEAVQET